MRVPWLTFVATWCCRATSLKLHIVVTVTDPDHLFFQLFRETLPIPNDQLHIMNAGADANGVLLRQSFPQLMINTRNWLHEQEENGTLDDMVVMYTDAYDVIFNTGTEEQWLREFDRVRGDKEVVLASEASCWVGNACGQATVDQFPKAPEGNPRRFINAGQFMGRGRAMLKMLAGVVSQPAEYLSAGSAQLLVIHNFFNQKEDLALDYDMSLFGSTIEIDDNCNSRFIMATTCEGRIRSCCINSSPKLTMRYSVVGCEITRTVDGVTTKPLSLHFNGLGKALLKDIFLRKDGYIRQCYKIRKKKTFAAHITEMKAYTVKMLTESKYTADL